MTFFAFGLVKAVVCKLMHFKGFSWWSQGCLVDTKCWVVRGLKRILALHPQHSVFPESLVQTRLQKLQQKVVFHQFPNVIYWKKNLSQLCVPDTLSRINCSLMHRFILDAILFHTSGCSVLLHIPRCFPYHLFNVIPWLSSSCLMLSQVFHDFCENLRLIFLFR